jgi:hypothetical protein
MKVLGIHLPKNLEYLDLSVQLRAPRTGVGEKKQQGQQGPSLFLKHSVYFCFEKSEGENPMLLQLVSCSPCSYSNQDMNILADSFSDTP